MNDNTHINNTIIQYRSFQIFQPKLYVEKTTKKHLNGSYNKFIISYHGHIPLLIQFASRSCSIHISHFYFYFRRNACVFFHLSGFSAMHIFAIVLLKASMMNRIYVGACLVRSVKVYISLISLRPSKSIRLLHVYQNKTIN